jgi:hypothetical protein
MERQPARLAVPLIERFSPAGDVERETDDLGLRFPLPALNVGA